MVGSFLTFDFSRDFKRRKVWSHLTLSLDLIFSVHVQSRLPVEKVWFTFQGSRGLLCAKFHKLSAHTVKVSNSRSSDADLCRLLIQAKSVHGHWGFLTASKIAIAVFEMTLLLLLLIPGAVGFGCAVESQSHASWCWFV